MFEKLTAHESDIACARDMIYGRVVKTVCVFKISILHAELFCALVHFGYKRLFASAEMLGESDGGVVCAGDGKALEQFVDAHLLALLEENLRAAHLACPRACRHHIGKRNHAVVYRFGDEKHSHDFRDGSGRQRLIRILFV